MGKVIKAERSTWCVKLIVKADSLTEAKEVGFAKLVSMKNVNTFQTSIRNLHDDVYAISSKY